MIDPFAIFLALFPIYGVVSLIIWTVRKQSIKAQIRQEGYNPAQFPALNPLRESKIIAGRDPRQVLSFITSIALAIIAFVVVVLLGLTALVSVGGETSSAASGIYVLWFWLFILCLLCLLAIVPLVLIFNALWIYPRSLNYVEQFAFMNKQASKLLVTQHVLAWITWGLSLAGAFLLAFGGLFPNGLTGSAY